ncbi:DNRLRE domain-containing protein [Thermoactinomyces mirandus]|uniref:DNRLRE domain-containing protein n=1 Tax=Thermoactinomyces mirandus TaxID=2756294 RepID=UPI0035E42018
MGEYSWDLTSLAQDWYSGTTKNYGVSLRHQIETNDRKSFRSSDYATDPTKKPKHSGLPLSPTSIPITETSTCPNRMWKSRGAASLPV